jgi:hypothetical protein
MEDLRTLAIIGGIIWVVVVIADRKNHPEEYEFLGEILKVVILVSVGCLIYELFGKIGTAVLLVALAIWGRRCHA